MQMKKVLAGGLAAITAGATLALGVFAGLGDYADSTVTPPFLVVIGDSAAGTDVLGAADIAAALAGYVTESVSTGAGAQVSVNGGADVSTADNKLYMGSKINKAKNTLTSVDLPTLLAKGSMTVSGVAYEYDQYITLGSTPVVSYNTIPAASKLDPILYLSTSSGTSVNGNPTYNLSVVFNKPLNVSNTNVQSRTVTFFGNEYTIGSGSGATNTGYNPLELFGYGKTVTLERGVPVEVTVNDVPYTIEATYIGSNQLLLKVGDATSPELQRYSSEVVGGLNIYVKSILPAVVSGDTSMAVVSLGSSKLTLTHGTTVQVGESTNLDGTLVNIVGDANGISKITVSVAASESAKAFIEAGEAFTDPVFGSFKVAFNGLTPGLTDSSRDVISISGGTTTGTVSFKDYKGNDATLNWVYDNSGTIGLNATTTTSYHIVENDTIQATDYFLFAPSQESEFGHIFRVAAISGVNGANPTFRLEDVITGSSTTYNIDKSDGITDIYIDGQLVQVANVSTSQVKITWGSGSTLTAFPLIKLAGGEYMTFIDNSTTLTNTSTYELPGNTSAVDFSALDWGYGNVNITRGQIRYTFTNSSPNIATLQSVSSTAASNNLLINEFPAILIMQEKDNSTTQDFIAVEAFERDTTSHYVGVRAPTFSDTGGLAMVSHSGGTYMSSAVNSFGTYATYYQPPSAGQEVKVYYPDTQAVAAVGVGANPTFAEGQAGTVEQAKKITTPVAKFAGDITPSAPGADMILVGGPCANALVEQLAADNAAIPSCSEWDLSEGIIQEVANAFGSGKKALVVAGDTGADTRALAAALIGGTKSAPYSA